MITRIELDGFKTFQNFALDLGPFQVIVGSNGAGKSNLFDAFRLLSRLAATRSSSRYPLDLPFRGVRGETEDLFTILANGKSTDRMKIAVEMLVEPKITDRLGETVTLKCTRLRYELEVKRTSTKDKVERIQLLSEALRPILGEQDEWIKRYGVFIKKIGQSEVSNNYTPPKAFISTYEKGKKTMVKLHEEGRERDYSLDKIESTVLASIGNAEFPHALAVQQELENCHFLQLNPEELRYSRFMRSRLVGPISPDGLDLPRMLNRMQKEDKFFLRDVSRDLAELIPGILNVELKSDSLTHEQLIMVKMQDERAFSWQNLSDGSLRLLALAVLANDSTFNGVLCMEEPENGVHTFRLKSIARLLKRMATDFTDPEQLDEPLRQVLVATHSPILISQPEVVNSLLFAYMATQVNPNNPPLRVTHIEPVRSRTTLNLENYAEAKEGYYTIDQVEKYLNTTDFGEAFSVLEGSSK